MLRGLLGRRAAARPAAAPAATAVGAPTPRLITRADFTPYTPLTGNLSRLAALTVPNGELLELDAARPFRMILKAGTQVTDEADASGDLEIDLGSKGWDLIQTPRPAGTLPSAVNPNVIVRKGDGSKVTIKAINYSTGKVTVTGLTPVTEATLDVYAVVGAGEVKLRAVKPTGGIDVQSVELFNDTLRALHETDQANGETAPRLMRGSRARFPLGPKWVLQIEVSSALPITFAAASEPVVELHGYRVPIAVSDPATVNAVVAARLR